MASRIKHLLAAAAPEGGLHKIADGSSRLNGRLSHALGRVILSFSWAILILHSEG